VGNGNLNVGNGTTNCTQPAIENVTGGNSPCEPRIELSLNMTGRPQSPAGVAVSCGAMSQQAGEFGDNISAPQGFLHLVGCRERKVTPGEGRNSSSYPPKR
jgi:hypothetical protein